MKDIYAEVTQKIIASLEQGTAPWVCPWSSTDPCPRNAVSQRAYRGVNALVLSLEAQQRTFSSNTWMTFRQALMQGGSVRKGEHATPIIYFRLQHIEAEPDDSVHDATRRLPFLKFFRVFNVDQIDGLPACFKEPAPVEPAFDACTLAEQIITRAGAVLRPHGSRAFYAPALDLIYLPQKADFAEQSGYYSTCLHELCHWTGHPSRLDRQLGRRFGPEAYAAEELIAELGASFLCAHCHIDSHLQHAAYIATWLEALQRDQKAIFVAAAQAQKAGDFLLKRAGLLTPDQDLSQAA